jgi:DNA-binding MarR family transcriptional regulator
MSSRVAPVTTQPREPDELVDALVQTSFVTTAVLTRIGAEHDVSLTLLRVGGILRDRRLRMTALADYLGLERSTLSGLVDRAEQRGFIERAPSAEDGRAVDVFLTAAGKVLADRLHSEVTAALAPLTGALVPAERRQLQRLLGRILAPGAG